MWLYPRLPKLVAEQLARDSAMVSVKKLATRSALTHADVIYGPTGGGRVSGMHLGAIRKAVVEIATTQGYPGSPGDAGLREFDAACAAALHKQMNISPSEASHVGVWAFIACVLLPDIVRWRFPGDASTGTTAERFIGGSRGLRNTFGRLWWRAELLQLDSVADPYRHLRALGEDEVVQITERPNIAGNRRVTNVICAAFIHEARHRQSVRSHLLRDAMKRVRRLSTFVALEALDDEGLHETIGALFRESANSLTKSERPARHQPRRESKKRERSAR